MIRCGGWFMILCFIGASYGWDEPNFLYNSCYQARMDERMPLSIDNFIALVEQFERDHSQSTPEDIAEAILYRYRTNGIVYKPDALPGYKWTTGQDFEVRKEILDNQLLDPTMKTPVDSFIPREECSLHMSVSHSTDQYPHAGIDSTWEKGYNTYRSKRQANYGNGITKQATHPVEFGVIQTASGPVALGLVLSGIMTMYDSRTYPVSELILYGKNYDIPSQMLTAKVDQLYGATVSGKLGQAAILVLKEYDAAAYSFDIGPIGRFGNCTSCARIFSLENNEFSYFSRAEVFGSLDGLIIAKTLGNRGDSRTLKLSQILRMYYSNHGLFNEDIRACNRHNIYNSMKSIYTDDIQTYALNYMYAYQSYFPVLQTAVQGDFETTNTLFKQYLNEVFDKFESFLSSYQFDDPDAERCPEDDGELKLETETDLVVIFTPVGSINDVDKQAQYIAATARKIGVGYHRSRLLVYNGRDMRRITPMLNYSNIADYSCNYTTFMNYGTTSSQDFIEVLGWLASYYHLFYNQMRKTEQHTGNRNQVVMWNLPTDFKTPSDEFAAQDAWSFFNNTYPDVNFIFVGLEQKSFFSNVFWGGDGIDNIPINKNNKIVIVSNSDTNPDVIAKEIITNIKKVPRMFIYPACDTSNSSLENYQESSHEYTNFVTPNYTTIIRIPPQNFHFSESVKLMFDNSDTDICVSRINPIPSSKDKETETTCLDGSSGPEFIEEYLCDRYVEDCDPIYISVTGKSTANKFCSDETCKFPNQIEFTMTHEGMVCGSWAILPTPILLVIVVLLQYFKL